MIGTRVAPVRTVPGALIGRVKSLRDGMLEFSIGDKTSYNCGDFPHAEQDVLMDAVRRHWPDTATQTLNSGKTLIYRVNPAAEKALLQSFHLVDDGPWGFISHEGVWYVMHYHSRALLCVGLVGSGRVRSNAIDRAKEKNREFANRIQ